MNNRPHVENILEMFKIARYISAKEYAAKFDVTLKDAEGILLKLENDGHIRRRRFAGNGYTKQSGGVLYTSSTRGEK
jgi:hypothetical protein